ncbi:MAG: CRISPR-associated helicase Cas3' [Bacteroidales bacterium]|jgi:CRISPR-associated endonuclease/helicase Cas3|nr:CRISPR-associated helicase Cas3' [Bacteroidales bacterium]
MGSDLEILKSHPDKFLLKHIQGVRENVKKLTELKIADLVAIFHDLGKINPNFQAKLNGIDIEGYANHSYLSAYALFCAFGFSHSGNQALQSLLCKDYVSCNDVIALIILIAKHHGNLPDFSPNGYLGADVSILSKKEIYQLFQFFENNANMPLVEYVKYFLDVDDFESILTNDKAKQCFSDKLIFQLDKNIEPLSFFLDYQFAFASVIQADKADAGKFENFIERQKTDVADFSNIFTSQLPTYLSNLKQNTELNKLRTKIREEVIRNIQIHLKAGEKVFELTSPTGSGKTLMLLSLASEIIKEEGAKRIIYALPFLSITEQVEAEILKIFDGYENYIQRIDSKSDNNRFDELQKELDSNSTEEKLSELNVLEFQENTFAYPLVITTFVRFFETLLSNRNSELLKLPNFSNCIFLLDEIQSLPPRLYGFFVAYLKKFCEKFGSYAIISTATQPNFELPSDNKEARNFFFDYKKPTSLLPIEYFNHYLFNRYSISYKKENLEIEELKGCILAENKSVLVILNTIDDTKDLFKLLQNDVEKEELLLLNTHFTPQHRKLKIYLAKRRLREGKRIILISTQLIEAGVDIDFPVLYRDFATIASVVQSAGRCNRNGRLEFLGKIILFRLCKNGKPRSELIYGGKDKDILRFTKEAFQSQSYEEKELIYVQQSFFNQIQSELLFAQHSQNSPKLDFDFLKDISECMCEKIGKFQLIDEQLYGKELQYFVSKNENDKQFEELLELQTQLVELFKRKSDINTIKRKKKKIEIKIKRMSNQMIQIRLKRGQIQPPCINEYFNLYQIDRNYYDFEKGIDLLGGDSII